MKNTALACILFAFISGSGCRNMPIEPPATTGSMSGNTPVTAVANPTGISEAMATEKVSATVEPKGNGQWLIRVTHTCGGETASGEVVIVQTAQPNPDQAPHAGLAGAKAYLSIAKTQLRANIAKEAADCAQLGIQALGEKYAPRTDDDDTGVKLRAAKNRISAGELTDGATVMINVLEIRISLYEKLYGSELGK